MASKRQQRKQKEKEVRELTRKEIRQNSTDRERNLKYVKWTSLAIGIAVLFLLIGLIFEFLVTPNSKVATVGNDDIVTKDYRKRVMLERNQLYNQLGQYQQLEQQFGGQGYFTNQITQLQTTLSNSSILGMQVLEDLISEKVLLKEAETRGIDISDEEIENVLREEVAAGQQAVTIPQATETAEMAVELTVTADTWTPTPLPTIDISNTITATATPVPTATPRPILDDALYAEGLETLEDNLQDTTNMSLSDYREVVRARLVEDQLREQISAESVEETEPQVNARHILLRPRDPTPTPTEVPADVTPEPTIEPTEVVENAPDPTPTLAPRTREETLAEAEELRTRIVEGGEDFAELALEYSDDTGSGAQGGDLDWFGTGQMVAPFEEAAFNLEIGEVSEPISTTFGYHIIEVLGRDDTRPKDESRLSQEREEAYQIWLQSQINALEIDRPESITDKLPASLRGGSVPPPSLPPAQQHSDDGM